MSKSSLNSKTKGAIGEQIACDFLVKKGYIVIERNYLKKWGEIDIVAKKDNHIHFIEVKSVTEKENGGNFTNQTFRPEENVHVLKQRRLRRTIQTYLLERKYGLDTEFFFHIAVIRMNTLSRRAGVSLMENIIL